MESGFREAREGLAFASLSYFVVRRGRRLSLRWNAPRNYLFRGGDAGNRSLRWAACRGPSGRAVEHYEMSRYGALKARATQLGMKDAAALLDQTPQEEKKTDALLSKLAQATVDKMAA